MDVRKPLALLGGMSPSAFMRGHWQKQPLLVRQALPGVAPPVTRARLFELAAQDDVESRLVVRREGRWSLKSGPLKRRALPPLQQPDWTLLVQGLDLHEPAAHQLLRRFAFLPHARLDDLMLSYASPGGGVGPHIDSYDVFLIQVHGRRRWRVGPVDDDSLVDGLPLKILSRFKPAQEWVLEPGDMLYLPPRWGHDGVAEDECMTCSVGFRAPQASALAAGLLERLAEFQTEAPGALYRDPGQPATQAPGRIPPLLEAFAARALQRALSHPDDMAAALGELLTEPKPQVWFAPRDVPAAAHALRLDPRTRMLYGDRHVFINGESLRAGGRDARLMRQLADEGTLPARGVGALSKQARALVDDWVRAGWLHGVDDASS